MSLAFIQFRFLDAVDILLVALLLYELYKLIKGSVAISIFLGILSVYFIWLIVKALEMDLLGTILGQFIGVGVIALIVVFQQEIRRFLLIIGTNGIFGKAKFKLFDWQTSALQKQLNLDIPCLIKACKNMSQTKTGAIMVITTDSDLKFYVNTGDLINAKISQRLIESIFFKNNPLHDGAVIITNNQIMAARCVLPVTENPDFPANLGMRHRAAVGITEISDAVVVIVSEQTGDLSFAKEGQLKTKLTPEKLQKLLENIYN
ncbi:MAG: TIGR00159 family protein [Bacteroidia bacterium]|nr:TIGR00159 family protein [Bacteroidia bacterium]